MDLPAEIKKLETIIRERSVEKAELMSKLTGTDMAISEAMGALKAFEAVHQRGTSGVVVSGLD